MAQYIDKSAVVAEIERRIADNKRDIERASHKNLEDYFEGYEDALALFKQQFLDILEVKEVKETMSIAYVVTRSEEHSDYVEKVFFDEDKAQEYCDQFKGNEDEYARHITRVKVTL